MLFYNPKYLFKYQQARNIEQESGDSMQTLFKHFSPPIWHFFIMYYLCCLHAKVEHKIPCRSFPHDHDHEHRLYVPGCTQIAKFKIFENPPYVQSPFKQKFFFEILIFPLAPIGVFPPGSAHARPSAQPLSTPAEICLRMCLGWGGIESFLAILGNSKHFSFLNGPGGGRGVQQFLLPQILFFVT